MNAMESTMWEISFCTEFPCPFEYATTLSQSYSLSVFQLLINQARRATLGEYCLIWIHYY